MNSKSFSLKAALRTSTALLGLALAGLATSPANAIIINDAYTPAEVVDTTNVTGVGQMVIDQLNGYLGLCTGTLINPRTVIFAAHCVNETPANQYGSQFGGYPMGFFFNANNLPAIRDWYFGVDDGPYYLSRPEAHAYNVSYVVYKPESLAFGPDYNFLQSDVAMAALDTPAVGIPTWTLLFSPLDGPTHATITGYGVNGIGTDGTSGNGIDYRRRSAENIISMLGSLDDLDYALFGSPDGLPQNLYHLDFNDPLYGTAEANWYDFNIFHDAALPKEGITAPGDSGGPLIVDQLFNKSVVAAVLSGGDRFWGGQPNSSYGTTSFYQPLYLFWDWIVTNNPYKYVSAKAGDGSWTDPMHWVINLDPNYATASGTTLTNALPTTPAQDTPVGDGVNTPKFGQVCYFDYMCYDVNTGEFYVPDNAKTTAGGTESAAGGQYASTPAQVAVSSLGGDAQATRTGLTSVVTPSAMMSVAPAEGGALVNGVMIQGAPGSSNFVPNNTDGDPTEGMPARYYDVTLSAAGTTTISNADIIVDRLTINGASTGLVVSQDSSLLTMIDATVFAGNFRVDGLFGSQGDVAMMGGVLSGNGAIWAPAVTTVLGAIAPGTVGTTGTLEINGDVVMSSASGFLVDVSANSRDLLDVYGTASIGGTLVVTPVGGYVPKWHEQKTVLYADSIVGQFNSVPDTIAGILYPKASTVSLDGGTYQAEVVTFEAGSYAALEGLNDDQMQIAKMLDGDRNGHYQDLQALYDAIDPLSGGALGGALENLVPHAARTASQVTGLLTDASTNSLWQYLGGLSHSGEAHIALDTSALKLTQNSTAGSYEMRSMLSNLGAKDSGLASAVAPVAPINAEGGMKLPKGWGGFLTGQAIDGFVDAGGSTGKANVDGWLVSLGVDFPASEHFRAGVSVALGEAQAKVRSQPAITDTSTKQLTVYGQYDSPRGYFVNGFVGGSIQSVSTERDIVIGASTFHVKGHTRGTSAMFGAQVGTVIDGVFDGEIRPAAGFQYARPTLEGYNTYIGTAPAEAFMPYAKEELDLRIGFDANWKIDVKGTVIRPSLHLFLVDAAASNNNGIQSALAAAPGNPYTFTVPSPNTAWAEIGAGTHVDLCEYASLGFQFSANPGRGNQSYQTYTGSLKVNF